MSLIMMEIFIFMDFKQVNEDKRNYKLIYDYIALFFLCNSLDINLKNKSSSCGVGFHLSERGRQDFLGKDLMGCTSLKGI